MTREEAKKYFVQRVSMAIDGMDKFPTIPLMAYEMAIEALSKSQIIRCKDCKWYGDETRKWYETCIFWVEKYGILIPTMPYDFCSRAERREL